MKKSGNKAIKFLAAMSTLIFSGLVAFTGSLAWFTSKRAADNTTDGFHVIGEGETIDSIELYTQQSTSVARIYNSAPTITYTRQGGEFVPDSQEQVSLGVYSQLEVNKSILFIATISPTFVGKTEHKGISVRTSTETPKEASLVYMNEEVTPHVIMNKLKDPDAADPYNPMSSIVSFAATSLDTKTYDFSEQAMTTKSFVEMGAADYTYYQNLSLYSCEKGNAAPRYLAVIVEYNVAAFEMVYSENIGNEALENEKSLIFKKDWEITLG